MQIEGAMHRSTSVTDTVAAWSCLSPSVSPSAVRAELLRAVCEARSENELCRRFAVQVQRALGHAGCGIWACDDVGEGFTRVAVSCGTALPEHIEDLPDMLDVINNALARPEVSIVHVGRNDVEDSPVQRNGNRKRQPSDEADRQSESRLLFGAVPIQLDHHALVAGIWSQSTPEKLLRVLLELIAKELEYGVSFVRQAARLREHASIGQAVVQNAPLPIVVIDQQDRIVHRNLSSERLFGWPATTFRGRTEPLSSSFEWHQLICFVNSIRKLGMTQSGELKARRADGTPLILAVHGFPVRCPNSNAGNVVLLMSDVSDHVRAERDLQMLSEIDRIVSNSDSATATAVSLLDTVGRRFHLCVGEFWSIQDDHWTRTALWRRSGLDDETVNRISGGVPLSDDVDLQETLRAAAGPVRLSSIGTTRFAPCSSARELVERRDSVGIPVRADGRVAGAVLLFGLKGEHWKDSVRTTLLIFGHRIGELISREQLSHALGESEQRLNQSGKMESLGLLAGAIAHDFNNLLTIIMGHGELAGDLLDTSSPVQPLIAEIQQAGERATSLTRQLLTFSRKDVVEARTIHVNSLIEGACKLLDRLLDSNIRVELELEPHAHCALVDPSQLEQVLLNLVLNARDAMPDGGELVIRTRNVECGRASLRRHPKSRPGPYVAISVTDSGCGMDEETISRAFEPFFTTKGPQRGTGMGLATVYGIVSRSEGFLDIQSRQGMGTTLSVYLPKSTLALSPRMVDETDSADDPRGNESILLVEDEDVVRNLAQRILEIRGYTVHAVADGDAALKFLDAHAGDVDLLLTDVVLPGLSGEALADQVHRRYPRMKFAFMSGYPDTKLACAENGKSQMSLAPLLIKPYTSAQLAQHVRAALVDHPT